jgi:very-short-patch-repair endonuclease
MFTKQSEPSIQPLQSRGSLTPSGSPMNGGENTRTGLRPRIQGERIWVYTEVGYFRRPLREKQTWAETVLWERLRGKKCLGLKFRRQHGIGPYIVDFYCSHLKLIIEVDGSIHENPETKQRDLKRQGALEEAGYKFLRFTNQEVLEGIDSVLARIRDYPPLHSWRGRGRLGLVDSALSKRMTATNTPCAFD